MINLTDSLILFLKGSLITVSAVLVWSYWLYIRERQNLVSRQFVPSADEIKNGLSPERKRQYAKHHTLALVLEIVEPKAKAGTLQEESVLSALEGRLFPGLAGSVSCRPSLFCRRSVITFFRLVKPAKNLV